MTLGPIIALASEAEMTGFAIDLARHALIVALELSLPMLLIGLVVGLAVSLFQALTQLQEQTLTFIPKILSVGATLFVLLPWMLMVLSEYTKEVFSKLQSVGGP